MVGAAQACRCGGLIGMASPDRPVANGRWLVVGALGMLGTELVKALAGRDVTAVDRPEIDITDHASAFDWVAGHDVVVNCAAWTAVDDAETHEDAAFRVNATGVANLATAVRSTGAWMVQVSTDYVFAGDAREPYPENALLDPRSAYGRTKAAGEWALRSLLPHRSYLLRTAWLYGANGPNFVATMAKLEATRETVSVVADQVGQPTWARDLAGRIRDVVDVAAPAGTYHATNSGRATWFDFAQAVFQRLGADPARVLPTTSDAFVRPAPRPSFSVLGHDGWAGTGLAPLGDWREALGRAFDSGLIRGPA